MFKPAQFLGLEGLEPRTMMSAVVSAGTAMSAAPTEQPTVYLREGFLVGLGTSGNDRISIGSAKVDGVDYVQLTINQKSFTFLQEDVQGVYLGGLEGNDIMSNSLDSVIPVTLDGGTGNNVLTSSADGTVFQAGSGNTTIKGQNATLYLDNGNYTVIGGIPASITWTAPGGKVNVAGQKSGAFDDSLVRVL